MKDTDAAWLAGIFDGEGSVNLSFKPKLSTKGAWVLRLRITNTHRPTIDHISSLMGFGHINVRNKHDNSRESYEWQIEAISAVKFLEIICPFCITKKRQAEVALEADGIRRYAPRQRRAIGTGRGGPSISEETHNILKQISEEIKALNGHKPVTIQQNMLPPIIWPKEYTHCKECGDTDRPHHGRGLCRKCYARIIAREYRAGRKAASMPPIPRRNYYQKKTD